MKKTLAIFCWYRSMRGGGLHENIRDSVKAAKNIFDRVVVVCPVSWFSINFLEAGADVLEVDFDSETPDGLLLKIGHVDFVHLHPGKSRLLGLKIAKLVDVPAVMTIHGAWFDGIEKYWSSLYRVIAVSQHIEFEIRKKIPEIRHAVVTICNGVDPAYFFSGNKVLDHKNEIVCVSRFDRDKQGLMNFLIECWKIQQQNKEKLTWTLAGDGPSKDWLLEQAEELIGIDNVKYIGWVEKSQIMMLYSQSRYAVAPGRSAIEALACGVNVAAVGSSGGVVFIQDVESFKNAMYSNFGGFGTPVDNIAGEKLFENYRMAANGPDEEVLEILKSELSLSVVNRKLEQIYIDGLK